MKTDRQTCMPFLLVLLLLPLQLFAEVVDTIIEGEYVVLVDKEDTVLQDGAVAVRDGVIVSVGPRSEIHRRFTAPETVAGTGRIVMPGLVNGHTHAAMTLLRGLADDLPLMTWLNDFIFPAEVAFVDPDFVRVGTELACWEMLRGGTTTIVDMYYFPDVVANVVEQCGLRALVASTVINQRSPDAEDGDAGLEHAEQFIRKWQQRSPRVTPILGPHAIYTTPPKVMMEVRRLSEQLSVPVSIHMAESRSENTMAKSTYGKTTISLFEEIGFLDSSNALIGAHVVWPSNEEIILLEKNSVGVIHNPTSNMKVAAGISPVTKMLAAGVSVGIGTDGAASNNNLDMWEEMRMAAMLQKVHLMDPTALPANTVLRMATEGGAEAIGLGHQIGSLEAGKRADLIQVSLNGAHMLPLYDVVSHLVYVAGGSDVAFVMVDGKVVVRDGVVKTLNTERVTRQAKAIGHRIRASLEKREQVN